MSAVMVHLLGDAILDNYYRLSDPKKDLNKELTDLGFEVNNCAIDDVKVSDVINGVVPKEMYTKSRSYKYPIQKDGKMYPLRSVLTKIGIHNSFQSIYSGIKSEAKQPKRLEQDNMVVISMGGGDVHSKVKGIMLGGEYFINSVVTSDFVNNFKRVIETVQPSCPKIVLLSIYLPYLGVGSSYGMYAPFAKTVMHKWNKFINGIAKQYNIPVLDLSRTLDVGNRDHYGTDDTRVSNITNKCMAQCLQYIYSHYDGHHIYYAPDCKFSDLKVE